MTSEESNCSDERVARLSDEPIEQSNIKNEENLAQFKLDLVVMPLMSLFYFFASLDRSNIGNARIAGLQSDLKLSDHQYSLLLTLNSITYVLIKVPSNLALKTIGAHFFLPMISFAWGLVTFLQGFAANFEQMATARLFLGLFEGGLYPGIILYLSQCYSRDQLQFRISIFFSTVSLSGSFSGLLAYVILRIDGTWGKPGWAWLFLVEGMVTMTFAIVAVFIFPASINSNRWLKPRQKKILTARLLRKSPIVVQENEKFHISEVIAAIKSPHVLILTVTQFLYGVTSGSIAYFTPTIVRSLGYSSSKAQLMTSPPFAVAFVFILFTGYLSDRHQARALTAGLGAALGFFGFMIFIFTDPSHTHVKYGSLFLAIPGIYSTTPPTSAWAADNSFGYYRKAVAIAFSFSASVFGSITSSWLFPESQSPRYLPGMIANLSCSAGIIAGVTLNYVWLSHATRYKRSHRGRIMEPYEAEDGTCNLVQNQKAWRELGDKHPDFQYVY